jgi:hypothetical protein
MAASSVVAIAWAQERTTCRLDNHIHGKLPWIAFDPSMAQRWTR